MELQNTKYYTPSTEEFHIGFEFEWKDIFDTDGWEKTTIDSFDGPMISHGSGYCPFEYALSKNSIRVKYLDKKDIESLGIWVSAEKEYPLTWPEEPTYEYYHNNNILRLRHYENGLVHIHNTRGMAIGKYDTFFSGIIKNKSELIKLMEQLKIN